MWPVALVKLVIIGLFPVGFEASPTPTTAWAPFLCLFDTILSAPLFMEAKQTTSGWRFSAPEGPKLW